MSTQPDQKSTKSAFPPGPWTAFYKRKYDEWHVGIRCTDGSVMMADLCPDGVPGDNYEECRAIAKLIAAAPDLFTALKAIIAAEDEFANDTGIPWVDDVTVAIDQARKALAKAEGK